MSTHPLDPARSERGVALIIVLLLLAVMGGLATGMTVNGHTEIAMATNESSYAGARAAAEAGMNRAIEAITADTTTNLLAGQDGAVDAGVAANAGVNADNGSIAFMLTGASPYGLGTSGQYTYTIQILDDDDPSLYTTLSAAQIAAMGEDGSVFTNANDRLVLRATGIGPSGTTVTVSRVLETVDSTLSVPTSTSTLSNPAILVDGDLTISGNPLVDGKSGNVHTNGDLTIKGDPTITGDATASDNLNLNGDDNDHDDDDNDHDDDDDNDHDDDDNDHDDNDHDDDDDNDHDDNDHHGDNDDDDNDDDKWHAGGKQGGDMPTINVPDIDANNYLSSATHILQADGKMKTVATGAVTNCPCNGWKLSGKTWKISGDKDAKAGTYFVNGEAHISGNPGKDSPIALSIIATDSIEISGKPNLQPENKLRLQFVTNGDLKLNGNYDGDVTTVEGQSLVREQLDISGNPDIRGQIIVKNVKSKSDVVKENKISGNPTVTYDGTFGALTTTTTTTTTATTYVNNVSGWMESQ